MTLEIKIFLAFMFSFFVSYFVMPVIINISHSKKLYDIPDERTSHKAITPSLGGLGIFIGFILSVTLFTNFLKFPGLQYLEFAMVVAFFLGMKDDIIALDPMKKTIGLLVAIGALVFLGGVRISSFYGLFGIKELPLVVSVVFSLFTFFVIINAVNLIDGINGLCTSTSLVSSIAFGVWFYLEGSEVSQQHVITIAAIIGALLAFLR